MKAYYDESIAFNPPIASSYTQREKYIQTKHTIKNPNSFEIDKISNDYITNHNKKYYCFISKVTLT